MQKLRSYVLPVAIALGCLFHNYCSSLVFLTPWLLYLILLLTFCAVDLRSLRPQKLDLWLLAYQVIVSGALYLLLRWCGVDEIVSQGILVGVLCPVAASSVVIACMLGANRATMTTFTILSNLVTVVAAPLYFSFIGQQQDMPFFHSAWIVFRHVFSAVGLPFLTALALQLVWPKANNFLTRYKTWSFYFWAVLFTITFGQTVHFIVLQGSTHLASVVILTVAAVVGAVLQFGMGRVIGRHYGQTITGQQLMGQKNSSLGIWMANLYLEPLSAVYLASYSIVQNIFNSVQIWWAQKHGVKET